MKTAIALVVLVLGLASPVAAAEITVLSTGGARAVMTSLVPEYERVSGDKLTISFATPGQMQDKLVKGEAADVAVGIAAIMPDVEKAGRVVAGSRAEFAASYVGVVVRAGAPQLDLATPEAIKRAVLQRPRRSSARSLPRRRLRCRIRVPAPSSEPLLSRPQRNMDSAPKCGRGRR